MLNEFPVIYTNIWDAVWAIPVTLFVIILLKMLFKLPENWLSTAATVIGLILSIFISHPNNLSAGIFMGFIYGAGASSVIYSMKVWFITYRENQ